MDVLGYDVLGDMDGDVLGDLEGEEVVGIIKAKPGGGHRVQRVVARKPAGAALRLPAKPAWRKEQLAPGINMPGEGNVPLPMAGQAGTPPGRFDATINQITFQGQLQKPFQPKRLLVSSVRTGATSVGRLLGVLYVGTDLQQAEIAGWDIELIGQAQSFDTTLTCQPAEPGVMVRMVVNLSQPLVGPDTIFASMMFLGNVMH